MIRRQEKGSSRARLGTTPRHLPSAGPGRSRAFMRPELPACFQRPPLLLPVGHLVQPRSGPLLEGLVRRLRRCLLGLLLAASGEGMAENEQAAQQRQHDDADPGEECGGDRAGGLRIQSSPVTHPGHLLASWGSKRQRAFFLPI